MHFYDICGLNNGRTKKNITSSSFGAVVGSGIKDKNIPDPQHCNILLAGFFSGSPKSRRQSAVIQKLADMIGYNVKLYDMTLQFLRTLFLRTRNVHYCTLRSELLMALHDRYRKIFVDC